MNYRLTPEQRLDVIVGSRLFNSCWFITNVGIAICQMMLLAQTWQQSHRAALTACVASGWIAGSMLLSGLSARKRRSPRLWGVIFVLSSLLWQRIPLVPDFLVSAFSLGMLLRVSQLVVIGFLMGMLSTAWLMQRRPWPPVEERVALAKGLLCTVVGLSLVWIAPAWAGSLGLSCLAPLLVLDFWPHAQCPLPTPGKIVENWYDSTQGADSWRLELHKRGAGWWWSYLAQRSQVSLILLASSISVLLSSVWSAVPTAFAAELFEARSITVLLWLVAGQLVAIAIAGSCFVAARSVLGPADRLIPQERRRAIWSMAIVALFLMAGCLLALGLPALQAPWFLAGSLALYTLAGAIWGVLLPRLKPSLSTVVFAQRHLMLRLGNAQLIKSRLAYERAQEELVQRFLSTTEGLLIVLLAPGIGWLVDQWRVDGVLVMAGLFLLVFLSIALALIGIAGVTRLQKANREVQWGIERDVVRQVERDRGQYISS